MIIVSLSLELIRLMASQFSVNNIISKKVKRREIEIFVLVSLLQQILS